MKSYLIPVAMAVVVVSQLSGCAGSASHKVVSANQAGDSDLTCKSIETEIVKTQVIIDGVNADKEDISGADVVDGILWFPFNLIAKNSNYNSSIEAADRRIEKLHELKKERGCTGDEIDHAEVKSDMLAEELQKLSKLHKDGLLTDKEYSDAKTKVLERF